MIKKYQICYLLHLKSKNHEVTLSSPFLRVFQQYQEHNTTKNFFFKLLKIQSLMHHRSKHFLNHLYASLSIMGFPMISIAWWGCHGLGDLNVIK